MIKTTYIANQSSNYIVAYENNKQQYVFITVSTHDFSHITDVCIVDNQIPLQTVLTDYFECTNIVNEQYDLGVAYQNIWKPCGFIHSTPNDASRAKRDIGIMLQKLEEILLVVDPSPDGLKAYGHKIRDLLILACTEVENFLKQYGFSGNKTTSDYVKILQYIDLSKYSISLLGYPYQNNFKPFQSWNHTQPSKSIPWYEAYNKTKHNKNVNFNLSTLENCINAIAACFILYVTRFSPTPLFNGNDSYSGLINSFITLEHDSTNLKVIDLNIPIFEGTKATSGAFYSSKNFHNGKSIKHIFDQCSQLPFTIKNAP